VALFQVRLKPKEMINIGQAGHSLLTSQLKSVSIRTKPWILCWLQHMQSFCPHEKMMAIIQLTQKNSYHIHLLFPAHRRHPHLA
jgi:hypothetical protein